MIPKECKRLAEVDFPIAVVSKHSAREKSIRHGHPSTLHLWWARRPLAACRAMLLALLLPDPCDPLCPKEFTERAKELLPKVQGNPGPEDLDLRKALLKFIGDFSNWDLSSNQAYLEVGRGLVKAAHPEETPLVVDPFAGGGSIPLEALRLGCETFASDLNPVACLILKVMLEDTPRHGPELAEELRHVGNEIKEQAEKQLAEFYPKDPDGATPIAYLWARTVRCEAPNCGAEIPLMRSFWLCKKANRKRALRYEVKKTKGKPPSVVFEIFAPKTDKEVPAGTVTRARATCMCCGTVLQPERVRAQISTQRGGAEVLFEKNGHRIGGVGLLAVVTVKPKEQGRHYRLPSDRDYQAVWKAQKRLETILDGWERGGKLGICPVPDESLPTKESHRAVGSQLPLYGFKSWGDLFTARQKTSQVELSRLVLGISGSETIISSLLSFALNRVAMSNMSCTRWNAVAEKMQHTFGRQALPFVWDFAEVVPIARAPGNWRSGYDLITDILRNWAKGEVRGQIQLADATASPLASETSGVWFTDPPYYDAIPYADLSDFFFVWLKRTLPQNTLLRDPFDQTNPLTPKAGEVVQCDKVRTAEGKPKDRAFYESAMGKAFSEGCRVLKPEGIGSVVFAHKTTEGWEALLSGMIRGGWTITGSWPISTEMGSRLNARDTASLATSVHLVCRPRAEDAPVGDWGEVLRELPRRVGDWMERLQNEGVRGADLVFACIGPALEIYSRYRRVESADGREVKLAEYLEKVWEVVGRTALNQILGSEQGKSEKEKGKITGANGALEEDARLTALFLWTLQSTNGGNSKETKPESEDDEEEGDEEEEEAPKKKKAGYSLIFDVVRRFAQPLGIHLPEWEGRIIETEKGVVRLLSVRERSTQLFGEESGQAFAEQLEKAPAGHVQISLFPRPEKSSAPQIKGRGRKARKGGEVTDESLKTRHEATTLDRVHAAMLLQSTGRTNALRALLKAEQDRSPDFLRLANALSALYPRESEEKRLLDAMLLAVPR
jgi:putative DNA methylase